ncbi:MAG: aminoacyl-tRNA hydrolase [Planctomycetes bacterium]|nr:aminoacyl-tRNA hydrolase [Planctomycetota bacterium]
MLELIPGVFVTEGGLRWIFSRSSGPGGQHANKSSTRVQLVLCLHELQGLSVAARARIQTRLHTRIDGRNCITVAAQAERSQSANRAAAMLVLQELLTVALRQQRKRRPSKPTGSSRKRRLEEKSQRGKLKQQRRADCD